MIDIREYVLGPDATPALDKAVAAALELGQTVYIPAGTWNFLTKPKPIGGGVTIRGESGLTTAHTGTCLFVRYSDPEPESGFLVWDGTDPGPSGKGYRGTGGGIRDLSIYKYGRNVIGGCAVVVKPANNTNHRSGMWTGQNVSIISENGGLWDRIFLADGSNIPPGHGGGGDVGVRTVTLGNFFTSGASVCNCEFRNAVHVDWFGGQVQKGPVTTPAHAGLKVSGADSQDINLFGVSVYGQLVLEGGCRFLIFDGIAIHVVIERGVSRSKISAVQCASLVNRTKPADGVIVLRV